MNLKLNEKGGKYWKFTKKLLILLALTILLLIIHEYIHYFVIQSQGYNAIVKWNIFLPSVSYFDLKGIINSQLFIIAISPYFLDLALLVGFYFYRKNKTIRLLAWIPFLHVFCNFLMFFVGLWLDKPNDFIIMFITGNGIFAIALVIIADIFWWKTIRYKGDKIKK